jgi:hypothetical protein
MPEYDRDSDGMTPVPVDREDDRIRPAEQRQRCGPYISPDGEPSWGDHRVTYPGSTCTETDCHVAHAPTEHPGWAEHMPDWHERPGVRAIAAALYGWDGGGLLGSYRIGDTLAWVAAHMALDALRDAGYTVTPDEDLPKRTEAAT